MQHIRVDMCTFRGANVSHAHVLTHATTNRHCCVCAVVASGEIRMTWGGSGDGTKKIQATEQAIRSFGFYNLKISVGKGVPLQGIALALPFKESSCQPSFST